jgi:Putative Flp pilus-assembly TadE/G-like
MMFKRLRNYLSDAAGNTAIIFALGALPLILATGAAVDYSRASRAKSVLQAAIDSAALGAMADKDLVAAIIQGNGKDVLKSRVESYLRVNNAAGALGALTDIRIEYDQVNKRVVVSALGNMDTAIMKLGGINSIDIGAVAEIGIGVNALEVALVLDNTGSMAGQKIEDLKVAAVDLVNQVLGANTDGTYLRIGVVPFSEYVNIGVNTPTHGWLDNKVYPVGTIWEGCVGSRLSPQDEIIELKSNDKYTPVGNVNCVTSMLQLTNNRAAIEGKISQMNADGATYIPAGLLWGWNMLTKEHPLDDAMSLAELEKLGGQKVIVLMTDGANTIATNGSVLHDGRDPRDAPVKVFRDKADALTKKLCGNIKSVGIKIFTVAFQVDDTSAKSVLATCASEPEMAFDAKNSASLKAAFLSIGRQLATLHLAR